MTSDATNRATRREWREFGFYYDRDDQNKIWKLTGSRAGLLRFRDALLSYAANPRNVSKSEHEHYGPYSYLEIMTWPEAGFDGHAIRGPLEDLARLAEIIEAKLDTSRPGSFIKIREEFAPGSPYALVLDLREDGFDPRSGRHSAADRRGLVNLRNANTVSACKTWAERVVPRKTRRTFKYCVDPIVFPIATTLNSAGGSLRAHRLR